MRAAFTADGEQLVYSLDRAEEGSKDPLYVVRADGTEPRELTAGLPADAVVSYAFFVFTPE